jgi:cell division inhibitor SepF
MGLGDLWSNALVYFGIAEVEEDDWDDETYVTHEDMERTYAERPNVRRLTPRGRARQQSYEDWTDEEPAAERAPRHSRRTALEAVPSIVAGGAGSPQRVHLVVPRSFNDAQQIADKFKEGMPVILNLQGSDADLSKRLIDFTSGLTYALNGGMQRVADKVFLLTPRNVEVSAEERARLLERGGFYNQA